MKKAFITFITTLTLMLFVSPALALTPTPTHSIASSPTISVSEKVNQQINQLKEKIASKVSELNLVEKRGIIGEVTNVSSNQITLTDVNGKTRYIDVDEITKFSSPNVKGSFGLSDITKGTKVSVLGLYNKESKRILGRFVDISIDPTFLTGEISNLDKTNFVLTITTQDNQQKKIDIETNSKIYEYTNAGGQVKYGFSKMNIGDRSLVVGFPDKKNPSLLVASRIIDFVELPKNPQISIPASAPAASVTTAPSPSGTKNNY